MEKNILLQIEYDGTLFSGWQRQPDQRTVQGTIERVINDLICPGESSQGQGERTIKNDPDRPADTGKYSSGPIKVDGLSRTDAGVHAKAQMVFFRADTTMPVTNLKKALNDRLSGRPESPGENGDIRVVSAKEVPSDFHVRHDAKGKRYIYRIRNSKEMPVFLRNYRYHVAHELDIEKMREAAKAIVGTHDFACFQAAGGEPGDSTVRTVTSLEVFEINADSGDACAGFGKPLDSDSEEKTTREEGPGGSSGRDILIDISGDGFLYNMVRIITGTLVEVGLGKLDPAEIAGIIESKDRTRAGHTAPPQGLCLEEAYY